MLQRTIAALILTLAVACTNSPDGECLVDSGGVDAAFEDAAEASIDDASISDVTRFDAPSIDDLGRVCTCTPADGPCCDGCRWLKPGVACDDGRFCTVDTYCLYDHTCVGGLSPCERTAPAPDCQAVPTCTEATGCEVLWTRLEGEQCPIGGDVTLVCTAGDCVNPGGW